MAMKTTFNYILSKRVGNTWAEVLSFERPLVDENTLDESLDFGKLIFGFIPLSKTLPPNTILKINITANYDDGAQSMQDIYRISTNVSHNQRTFDWNG